MSAVQAHSTAAAQAPEVLENRISIPFFRVQERRLLLAVVDAVLAFAWLLAAYMAWRALARPVSDPLSRTPWEWICGGTACWLLVSWLAGAYELERADRYRAAARTTLNTGTIVAIVALIAYYAFLKTYPRPALACVLVGLPLSVICWRGAYAALLRRPASAVRLIVVGNAALCTALTEAANSQEHFRVLGFVSEATASGPQYLGRADNLAAILAGHRVHRIAVAPRQSLPHTLVAVLSSAVEHGVEVVDFNSAYEEIAGKVAVEHAGEYWLAALPTRPSTSSLEELAMRLIDVLGAGIGLLFTAILGPLIAAAIFAESGGPLIYRQQRLGRGGSTFTIYKFRSMRPDAENGGARWATRSDSRATRVGRCLRKSHLDELPQFWNVLRGEMSLVGPRPERPGFTEELADSIPFYRLRLAVRPGLTGLKQIRVGYASSAEEHLEVLRHDLYYIKHRSLTLNLIIMARTVGSILGLNGR